MWWSVILQLALKWGVPKLVEFLSAKFPNAAFLKALAEILGVFAQKVAESPELRAAHEKEALAQIKKIRKKDSGISAPWNTKGLD